jgi:ribosome-associated protein
METKPDSTLPLLADIVRCLDDKKAGDLRVLKVGAQSSITDYLVLATGTSEPHLRALRVELEKAIDLRKAPIAGMDSGEPGSGPVSGCPCPRLHHPSAPARKPNSFARSMT